MTKITYIPGEIANAAIDEHGNRKPVTRTHNIFDNNKNKNQAEVNIDIDNSLNQLSNEIDAVNKQDVIPVDTLSPVATADPKKIYRIVGDDNYTDYMVNASGNDWKKLATYRFPGIDDEPTAGSNNLVKSGGVANKISKLIEKTSEITREVIKTKEDYISIEDNNGNKVFHLDENGLNAKNVKSNGKDVLIEHQDISRLATKEDVAKKQDIIPQISTDNVENVFEDISIYDDEGIELIHHIDKEGANFKNLKSNGVAVVNVGDSYTKEEVDAIFITKCQDISTLSLYNIQTRCISANYDENVFDYAEPTGKRISAQMVMKNIQGASQGGACYGNTLFVFSPQYNPMIISVVNLDKMQKVQEIKDIDNSSKQYHNNSAMFGNVKYDDSDPFPLLYVSSCYETIGFAGIRVFRITGKEGNYNMEVVQKIEIPKKSNTYDSTDKDSYIIGNYIYCIGNSSGDYYNISKFELPSIDTSIVTYTEEDILEQFTVSRGGRTRQGGFVKNGHIIAAHSNGLHDIDLDNKSASYFIFPNKLRMCETEFCFEYDGNLYVSAIAKPANFDVPSSQTNLFIIKFYK